MVKELDFEPKSKGRDLEAKAAYDRKYARERYHNDPETKEKIKKRAKEYWQNNKKKLQAQQNKRRAAKRAENATKG